MVDAAVIGDFDVLKGRRVNCVSDSPIVGRRSRFPLHQFVKIRKSKGRGLYGTWNNKGVSKSPSVPVCNLLIAACLGFNEDSAMISLFRGSEEEGNQKRREYFTQNAWVSLNELHKLDKRFQQLSILKRVPSEEEWLLGDRVYSQDLNLKQKDWTVESPLGFLFNAVLTTLFDKRGDRVFRHMFNLPESLYYTYGEISVPFYFQDERVKLFHQVEWLPVSITEGRNISDIIPQIGEPGVFHLEDNERYFHVNRYFSHIDYADIKLDDGSQLDEQYRTRMSLHDGIRMHLNSRLCIMIQHLLTHVRNYGTDEMCFESSKSIDLGMVIPYKYSDLEEHDILDYSMLILYNYICYSKSIPISLIEYYKPILDYYYNDGEQSRGSIRNAFDYLIGNTLYVYASWFGNTIEGKFSQYLINKCSIGLSDGDCTYIYLIPPQKFSSHPLGCLINPIGDDDARKEYCSHLEELPMTISCDFDELRAFQYVDISIMDDRLHQRDLDAEFEAIRLEMKRCEEEGNPWSAKKKRRMRDRRNRLRRIKENTPISPLYDALVSWEVRFCHRTSDVQPDFSVLAELPFRWGEHDGVTMIEDVLEYFDYYVSGSTYLYDKLNMLSNGRVVYHSPQLQRCEVRADRVDLCDECSTLNDSMAIYDLFLYGRKERCSCHLVKEVSEIIGLDQEINIIPVLFN
jgi:hypothetical protein